MNQSSSKKQVRLAILGTGSMASVHAESFAKIKGCRIVAAADVDLGRAQKFAATHHIPQAFQGSDALLKYGDFDAVAIVTPDPYHAPLSIQCLKAGKHVLCEKPLALHAKDAQQMVRVAQKAKKVAMVNLSYRGWSAIQAVAKLVHRGALGDIRHVESSYLQSWLVGKAWGDWRTTPAWLWRLSTKHGSHGVLGDVGVHIVDFTTFPVGPIASVYCQLKTFPKAPNNRIGEYVLDANDSAILNVTFKNGAIGVIHATRWCGGHLNRLFLKIAGTKGTIEIDSERTTTGYRICSGKDLDKGIWKEKEVAATPSNYERFIRAILTGKSDQPDFATGAEVQKVLDACIVSHTKRCPVKV